ncbi:MAG TPA: MmgE/PrpD family protein, partial [Chthonomonadales bacterium]|nr:MmgE/PrpD family protein [Chthonomonadales bacterium]
EKWKPTTRETADHSLPFCVAAALVDGAVTLDSFDDAHLANKDILELVSRTEVRADPDLDEGYPEGIPNRVTVHLAGGPVLQKEVSYPRGHARNPMTDSEVEAKFRTLAAPVLPAARIDEIARRVMRLEEETGVRPLLELLKVDAEK